VPDDDSILDHSASQDLGEIVVEIERVKVTGIDNKRQPVPQEQKVHERSKKATSHRVKLDDEVTRPHATFRTTQRLDKEPLVTFIFKYRSLEMLQANGIVSSNNPKKRQVLQLDVGRVQEEHQDRIYTHDAERAQRIKALEEELEVLKTQQNATEGSRPAKRVKREHDQARPVFVPGEVIDLT